MKTYLLSALLFLTFISCSGVPVGNSKKSDSAMRARCCNECLDSFGKSPAAIGKEGAWCGKFMTAGPLSGECAGYFEKNPATVDFCGRERGGY